jgi:spore maturation protein CgeB
MNFEIYNKGENNLKVAFFCKDTFGNILSDNRNVQKIAEYNNLEVHLLCVDFLDSGSSMRGSLNDYRLHDSNPRMKKLYRFILEYIKNNEIPLCIFFGSGYPWSELFLNKIKEYSYSACYFADDPEGSEKTSRYYVKNYQYAFCGGIYFDKNNRIEDKYKEWGAKKSKFIPLGACPAKYVNNLRSFKERDTALVYVGGAYLKKILRIFKLKKHFGERMYLYGRGWNYDGKNIIKIITAKLIKGFYNIPNVNEITNDELVYLYQNTKIGFNMHLSYGPSNQRLYELPANGVMQICDCDEGLGDIYEVGKEVVTYKTINEAIEKIEYYLKNDSERIKIAEAGYKKVKEKYLLEHSFREIKKEVFRDIKNNYPNYLKSIN